MSSDAVAVADSHGRLPSILAAVLLLLASSSSPFVAVQRRSWGVRP